MIVSRAGPTSRVKSVHRVADRVSRQGKYALIDDDDRDLAVADRLAAIVFDLHIDLCLAAGSKRLVLRLGRNRELTRCC